jgi:hypothetical protein
MEPAIMFQLVGYSLWGFSRVWPQYTYKCSSGKKL